LSGAPAQHLVVRELEAGGAGTIEVGEAQQVRRERAVGIKALRFVACKDPRQLQRLHGVPHLRVRLPREILEATPHARPTKLHLELGHALAKYGGQSTRGSNRLRDEGRIRVDRSHLDGYREGLPRAVEDRAAPGRKEHGALPLGGGKPHVRGRLQGLQLH
jgi:hypothetical protein